MPRDSLNTVDNVDLRDIRLYAQPKQTYIESPHGSFFEEMNYCKRIITEQLPDCNRSIQFILFLLNTYKNW